MIWGFDIHGSQYTTYQNTSRRILSRWDVSRISDVASHILRNTPGAVGSVTFLPRHHVTTGTPSHLGLKVSSPDTRYLAITCLFTVIHPSPDALRLVRSTHVATSCAIASPRYVTSYVVS